MLSKSILTTLAAIFGMAVSANAVRASTITVVNFTADGHGSLVTPGTTPLTSWNMAQGGGDVGQFVSQGNPTYSTFTGGVITPIVLNLRNQILSIFVLNQAPGGVGGQSPVADQQLVQLTNNQQYIVEILDRQTPEGGSPALPIYPSGYSEQSYSGITPSISSGSAQTLTTNQPSQQSPVPEPASLALLAIGAAGLLMARRRRRRHPMVGM